MHPASLPSLRSPPPPPPWFVWTCTLFSAHCQRMIDGLLQGSPSYVSPLTDLESNLSASLNKSSDVTITLTLTPPSAVTTHRKLLDLEGLENLFFCSLIRYPLTRSI